MRTILDSIPFQVDLETLAQEMRVKAQSSQAARLENLLDKARTIARPKALYTVAFIEGKSDSCVIVDGITFTSQVLRVNLEPTHRVFPFIITAGTELDDWVNSKNDLLYHFWADAIAEMALHAATRALHTHLVERYQPGKLAMMNPGSLDDWPLAQQRPLFALLGDAQAAIGVTLLDSLLMSPTKTVSGLYFTSQENFVNCQLCPREACRARKAPYDPDSYKQNHVFPS